MTAYPLGPLHRARSLLILALVALLTLAPAFPALAGEKPTECPPEGAAQPEMQQVLAELAAFAQQYQSTGTVPSQAEIEAKLTQLFALVDYVLAEADELTPEQVTLLLDQFEASLVAEGVPAAQVEAASVALADLLASETPPTPEQALSAILEAIRPYLLELGVSEAYIELLYTYLLKFLPAHTPPSECPTPAPSPSPTSVAEPVDNATPAPTDSESGTATTAPGGLAVTGIDPILLLGVVAVAMIAGGVALEAGQRRPARHRSARRR